MGTIRHIMITGLPGVGKSTLVASTIRELGKNHDMAQIAKGFYTEEVRGSSGRVGFDAVTLSGQRSPLARLGKVKGETSGIHMHMMKHTCLNRLALDACLAIGAIEGLSLCSGSCKGVVIPQLLLRVSRKHQMFGTSHPN